MTWETLLIGFLSYLFGCAVTHAVDEMKFVNEDEED